MPRPILPDVYTTIQDGGLGILPPSTDGAHALIGVASSGPQNAVVSITRLEDALATFGSGPLVESIGVKLALGARPVYAVRGAASTAGTTVAGTVTKDATSTGTVAFTGAAQDSADGIVKIVRGGVLTAATFIFSLDGGNTWSAEKAVGAGGVQNLGLNITATFAVGVAPGFVAGDTFAFAATAPAMTSADLSAAIDAVLADPREWEALHVVGGVSAAIAAAVAQKLVTAESNYRYGHAILETVLPTAGQTVAAWQTALTTDYAAFASKRVSVVASFGTVVSPVTGRVQRRNLGSHYAAWLLTDRVSASPGRVVRGAVPGIVSLGHDEFVSPGLDAFGFVTFRSYIGLRGAYVTNGRIFAGPVSDYQFAELRRTMDKACRLVRTAGLRWEQENIRISADGTIDERDGQAIELSLENPLDQMVNEGELSIGDVTIDPAQNVLSSSLLSAKVRLVPLGVVRWLELDIGFRNPKLEVS